MTILGSQLSRAETDELITSVAHFRALTTEITAPYYAWGVRRFERDEGHYTLFNFSRGAGGGELFGDSDSRMALVTLRALPRKYTLYRETSVGLPHVRIEHADLGAKLRGLFGSRVKLDDDRLAVFSDDDEGARVLVTSELANLFAVTGPHAELEVDDLSAVFSTRGAMREDADYDTFLAKTAPMMQSLS